MNPAHIVVADNLTLTPNYLHIAIGTTPSNLTRQFAAIVPERALRVLEPLTGNLGHGRNLNHQVSIVEARDLYRRGHRIGFREELLPYVARLHEAFDIRGIVREGDDVVHSAAYCGQYSTHVLQRLANLRSHIAFANGAPLLVERNLSLKMHNPSLALNCGHGECAERLPRRGWIDILSHDPYPRVPRLK